MHDDIQQVLLTEEEIHGGIERIAQDVTKTYDGTDLLVVSILKGSILFASDLIRRLPIPLRLAFVSAGSYGDGAVAGPLDIQLMPSGDDVAGRRVLLVDDILDTGRTLSTVEQALLERGAADVKSCVFLDKPSRRQVEYEAEFCCFEVQDFFVVGYGLDFAGRYRNLPFVASLKPEILASRTAGPTP